MENQSYIFTSSRFTGHVVFVFRQDGVLLKYDITEAQLDSEQTTWITARLPKSLSELQALLKKMHGAKLELQRATKVTFDMFWDRYNEKARSSKKKALMKWNRMSQTDRDRAYNFVPMYERNLLTGMEKKYAETYLNAELWNN